jgi:hypothetical protein
MNRDKIQVHKATTRRAHVTRKGMLGEQLSISTTEVVYRSLRMNCIGLVMKWFRQEFKY